MRKHGILIYSKELAGRVDAKTELVKESPEEVEIRASTVWTVELIYRVLKKTNSAISPLVVHNNLWFASQTKSRADKPYHRTLTQAY